ncbi:hypothetical protein STENM36S_05709 [Streptomyces tendae]
MVEFFRSIPVLVLMIFGLALFAEYTNVSSDDRPLYAVVTGLVLYNASVLAEIVRSGILALPKGQGEGAMAIGLRKGQVMRLILLPQAVTAMLPAIVSQLVVILKDTALGGAILTFPELLASANTMSSKVLLVRPDGHLVTALNGVRPADLYAAAESALGGATAGAATEEAEEGAGAAAGSR